MPKDRNKLYQIYHTVLSMSLTWAFVLGMNQYYSLRVNLFLTAVFSFIPVVLIYLFDLNRKNVISYILLVSIFPLLALIFWIRKINPAAWFKGLIDWCQVYNGSEELYKLAYAVAALLGLALLGTILFYLFTKNQTAKEALAVIIFTVLIILCVSKINVNKAVVGICIFYILTIVVEIYGIVFSKKAGRQDKKEGILYLAPICLLLAVMSIILPAKQEPIQWKAVKTVYNNVKEQMEIWQTDLSYYFSNRDSEFLLNFSGYSEDGGSLNTGSIKKDNRIALRVKGPEQGDAVYLIGSVSDIYTGSSWEKSRQDFIPGEKEYLLDYTEMFLALSRQDMEVLKNNLFLKRKAIKTTYNNIITKTLFYPLLTNDYDIASGYRKTTDEAPQITFHKALGKGTKYDSTYFDMNLEGTAFRKMLREADAFSYDRAENINEKTANYISTNILSYNDANYLLLDKNIYKILGERATVINSKYTQLPEELPDRVRKLAKDITKTYDTKYDKLKAIETFLMGYTYTLQPAKVPQGEDFTDYFLFESKEGYCTSFATAMAVMGRCIGVPTRYVEGFVAKCKKEDNDGMYPVKNGQAHAWAECYIEGVGWIPFEATAPYFNSRYTKWPEASKQKSEYESSYSYSHEPYPQEMYQPEVKKTKAPEKKDYSQAVSLIIIIFAALISLIIAVIIYYCVLKHRYKRTFEKSDYSRKMYLHFLHILYFLKREGITLGQQDTILMFSKRVRDQFVFQGVTFQDVAVIYMRYRYAEIPITKEEFSRVDIYCKGMSDNIKAEENRWKVWLAKFSYLIQADRQLKHRYNNT